MTSCDKAVYAIGKGTIHVSSELGYRIMLVDVLFVPGLIPNLLSLAVCMWRGGKIETFRNMIVVPQNAIPHFHAHKHQGLFKANFKTERHHHAFTAVANRTKDIAHEWHCRLCHSSYSSMMKMAQKGLVHGLSSKLFPSSTRANMECTQCTEATVSHTKYEHLKVEHH